MSSAEFSKQQLEDLIRRFPADPIDIRGVVLDYVGRTGASLDQVFRLQTAVYDKLICESSPESATDFVLAATRQEAELQRLAEACVNIFPRVSALATAAAAALRRKVTGTALPEAFFEEPASVLGHSAKLVVWQLSDIHFGAYNRLQNDPRQLAALLGKAAVEHTQLAPAIIVVSGDVSSIAADAEFAAFREFCSVLPGFVNVGGRSPVICVVPGNHDVRWIADGTADRMEAFRRALPDSAICISPFGLPREELLGGKLVVTRVDRSPGSVPPLAFATWADDELELLLMVSGYFSGSVPEAVRKALRAAPSREELHQLLRLDEGSVNEEYLYNLAASTSGAARARIAVIHHNPVQYGTEINANRLAPQLLETLFSKGVRVVLHGHTHLSEDIISARPISPSRAYPIPCPTLTSYPVAGERGFNVCILGSDGEDLWLSILVWSLSLSGDFKKEQLRQRYKIRITGSDFVVEHGPRT